MADLLAAFLEKGSVQMLFGISGIIFILLSVIKKVGDWIELTKASQRILLAILGIVFLLLAIFGAAESKKEGAIKEYFAGSNPVNVEVNQKNINTNEEAGKPLPPAPKPEKPNPIIEEPEKPKKVIKPELLSEGAEYWGETGSIKFYNKSGNSFDFSGTIGRVYSISGKATVKGNMVIVVESDNCSGKLSIVNSGSRLLGTLKNYHDYPEEVDYYLQ